MGFRKREKGQATIFMVIFVTTMIFLFAFTINIGMLVHTKINLQNAADSAAYAGAAVQARQMTAISYLNWEMRRAVKEFMFNWMVRGNRAQACFPFDSSGKAYSSCRSSLGRRVTRYDFSFQDPRPGIRYSEQADEYVPTTCIIFDPRNNYCQLGKVTGIPRLGAIGGVLSFVNPIIAAVRTQTDILIERKIDDCKSRGRLNHEFLGAWLFNLDENPPDIRTEKDSEHPFGGRVNSEDSYGVLPRQALLRARIDNLEEALNLNLQSEGLGDSSIDGEMINILSGDADRLFYYERPIQAYLSASNNLPLASVHNGIFSEISLEELIPHQFTVSQSAGLRNPPILFKLNDITHNLIVASSHFETEGSGGACVQHRIPLLIPSFLLGVTKEPSIITYYAVSLRAKARLLFSPFQGGSPVSLTAYSAAKPFGSRIGKDLSQSPENYIFSYGKVAYGDVLIGQFGDDRQFPNLLVSAEDRRNGSSVSHGFASNGNLGYLRQAIRFLGLEGAQRLAGAYAPWEIGYYNVPANFEQLSNFAGNPNYPKNSSTRFSLRVPVAPVNNPGASLGSVIRQKIESMMYSPIVISNLGQKEVLNQLRAEYLQDGNFVKVESFLKSTNRDQFHLIPDPILLGDSPNILSYARGALYGRDYTVAAMDQQEAIKQQLTSWNTVKSASDHDGERIGELGHGLGRASYSVRFIAFSSLRSGGLGTNDNVKSGSPFYTSPFRRISPGNESAKRILDAIDAIEY